MGCSERCTLLPIVLTPTCVDKSQESPYLCAPHYLNLFRNVPIPEGRSLRRASGLVLVGDQDVIQVGSGESVLGSRLAERDILDLNSQLPNCS
jgi:hypothetical protein